MIRAALMPYLIHTSITCGASCLLMFMTAGAARASFTGVFDVSNFQTTKTNPSDSVASVTSPDGGITVIITGPNDGSGNPTEITWTIVPTFNGTATFDWSFSSLDDPTLDSAGFIVNSVETLLANTDGQHGSNTVDFSQGKNFGFFAASADNQGEPGILTLTNFSFTDTSPGTGPDSTAPEPRTLVVCFLFGMALILARNIRAGGAKSSARRRA